MKQKLSLYLSSLGYNAMPLSLDDFFRNRDETPLDEFGQKDYECLEALDLSLFNNTSVYKKSQALPGIFYGDDTVISIDAE